MKKCPQCNRTYSDESFSFCLEDGALLSAPADADATLVLPNQEQNHLAPTIPAVNRQSSPGSARAKEAAADTLPVMFSPQESATRGAQPTRRGRWLLLVLGCLALVGVGFAVTRWMAVDGSNVSNINGADKSTRNIAQSNQTNTETTRNQTQPNANTQPNTNTRQDNTQIEKPTVAVRIGPFDYDYYGENLTETKWSSMPVTLISSAGRETKNVRAGTAANIRSSYVQFDNVPCNERVTIIISNSTLYYGAVPPVTLRQQLSCDQPLVNLGRYKIKVVEVG